MANSFKQDMRDTAERTKRQNDILAAFYTQKKLAEPDEKKQQVWQQKVTEAHALSAYNQELIDFLDTYEE